MICKTFLQCFIIVDIFHCGFDIHGLYLTTHSTHLVTVIWKEGKKEMFYFTIIWRRTYGKGPLR